MHATLLSLVVLLALALPAHAQHRSVRVQVIDRGQADGILIRTPNDKWVVIDAGQDNVQASSMANVWGVDEVALAIMSHRHGDHYGGFPKILRDFTVKRVVMNLDDCPNRSTDDTIRGLIESKSIPAQSVGEDTIEIDGVKFVLLPPDPNEDECPEHENDNSIVVRMEFGEFSMLFTGDAEKETREFLMENHADSLDVDVLKASHHGSFNGANGEVNGQSWMDVVDPKDVVISVLPNSPHGHPHDSAMDAYEALGTENVHCTSRHGTVRVYGQRNGRHQIHHLFDSDESCRFPGQ